MGRPFLNLEKRSLERENSIRRKNREFCKKILERENCRVRFIEKKEEKKIIKKKLEKNKKSLEKNCRVRIIEKKEGARRRTILKLSRRKILKS